MHGYRLVESITTVNHDIQDAGGPNHVLEDIPALLLVGGLGTRLQSVLPSTPKPLAPVHGVPFLQLLVRQLKSRGVRRIVMCTRHLASQVQEEFEDGRSLGVAIEYSQEPSPLGTAGAVKFAERHLAGVSEFLVMNGDSFLETDFSQFLRFHREHGGMMSMALRRVPDTARYGTVELGERNRVVGFSEKNGKQVPGLVNGGIYIFNRAVLEQIPARQASLETGILPKILQHGVYGAEQRGMFIDIGTPEDYARAQAIFDSLNQAALHQAK